MRNLGAVRFPVLAGQPLGDTAMFVLGRHSLTACAKFPGKGMITCLLEKSVHAYEMNC